MRTFTGGAQAGWVNASYPLAKLSVSASELTISASLVGTFRFAPGEVTAIEAFRWVPFIAQGIRIHHTRRDVPPRIVFWSLKNPQALAGEVHAEGFVATAPPGSAVPPQGFPFRIPFVIAVFAIWNTLFLLDRLRAPAGTHIGFTGPGTVVALGLLCITSMAVLRWGPAQRMALRSPESLATVAPLLKLVALVTAVGLVSTVAGLRAW